MSSGREVTQRPGSSSSEGSQTQAEETDKYSPDKIMMKLDRDEVKAMRDEFDEFFPTGIELPNFLWLMKCAIDVPPEEQGELVLGSYQLFHEIDINGDEHMEWAEFTQYIIDAVMGQQQREKKDDRELTPSEIMELAESHKSRRYKLSNVTDRSLHSGPVKNIAYCSSLDLVMVIEEGANTVKLYNLQSKCKSQIVPITTDKHDHMVPALTKDSYVLSVAYSEAENLYLVSASNRRFYVFENAAHSIRQVREFPVDVIEHQVWYFPTHRAWMSAGSDLQLKHWDVSSGKEFCRLAGHTQMVMDAVEITTPLCIASASLDGTVILWDLAERKPIVTLNKIGVHNKGVRSVDYCADYGGNITSVGFEKNIHVWSPEVSWNQCYIGKMEGHNCPVVACKFFAGRPVCASVDELGNVRLWDIRALQTLQILTHDRGKLEVSRLLTIAKHDKFVVAGHRLIWFELQKEFSATQSSIYDARPLFADFNRYYMEIVIVTKADLRVYDSKTGRLKRIYTDIHDQKYESEVTSFCFDHRHRKFFIGDSSGGIRTYNFSNGALMKVISKVKRKEKSEKSDAQSHAETKKPRYMAILEEMASSSSHLQLLEADSHSKQSLELFKSNPDDFYTEVSGLHFCAEDKMLVVSTWDSSLRIFDENDPDSSAVLRVMRGGHQGSNITAITYSPLFSLVASGASNGLVSVWDFELGKIEAALVGHTKEVSCIRFLEPYPVIMTAAHDFLVCFWYVRPFVGKMRYHCFYRVCNRSWGLTREVRTTINCFSLLAYTGPAVLKEKKPGHHKQLIETSEIAGLKETTRASSFTKFKPLPEKSAIRAPPQEEPVAEAEPSDDENYADDEETEFVEENYEWVEDPAPELSEDPEAEIQAPRLYAYLADVKGNVKVWRIDALCRYFNIPQVIDSERDKQTYNPRRKDEKNAENEVKFWVKESQEFSFPLVKRPWKLLSVKEWHAHKDLILTIQTIEDPRGLLTCSADRTVRTWDWRGQLWGVIAINAPEVPANWMFPFDWEAKRQKDIAKVTEVLNLIGEKMKFEAKAAEPVAPKKPRIRKQKDTQAFKAKTQKVDKPSTAQLIESLFAKQLRNEDPAEMEERVSESQPRNLRGHALSLLKRIEKYERTKKREEGEKSTSRRDEAYRNKKLRRAIDMNESASSIKVPEDLKSKTPALKKARYRPEALREEALHSIPEAKRASPRAELRPSASTDMLRKPPRRPLHGFDKSSLEANRKHLESLGREIQSMKHSFLQRHPSIPLDIKYQPGESLRALNRQFSMLQLQASSVLQRDDSLDLLRRKRNILQGAGETALKSNVFRTLL